MRRYIHQIRRLNEGLSKMEIGSGVFSAPPISETQGLAQASFGFPVWSGTSCRSIHHWRPPVLPLPIPPLPEVATHEPNFNCHCHDHYTLPFRSISPPFEGFGGPGSLPRAEIRLGGFGAWLHPTAGTTVAYTERWTVSTCAG